jgi:hypothetical protein
MNVGWHRFSPVASLGFRYYGGSQRSVTNFGVFHDFTEYVQVASHR